MASIDMDSVDLDSFHDVAEVGDKVCQKSPIIMAAASVRAADHLISFMFVPQSDLEQVFNAVASAHDLTLPLEDDVQSLQFMTHFLNRKDELKYTALHRAVFARNLEAFTFLLEKGCDANIKCHGTPLLQLLLAGSLLPEVRLLKAV